MWGFALTVSCDWPRLEELNFWFWSTNNSYFLTTDSINFNFGDTLIKPMLPYSFLADTCGACCYTVAITSLPPLSQQERNSQTLFEQLASILTLTSQLHEQVEYGGLLLLSSCPPLAPKYGVQRASELVDTLANWERGPPQFHGTFPDLTLCLHLTVHFCLFQYSLLYNKLISVFPWVLWDVLASYWTEERGHRNPGLWLIVQKYRW